MAASSVLLWCLNSMLAAARVMIAAHIVSVALATIILWLGPQPPESLHSPLHYGKFRGTRWTFIQGAKISTFVDMFGIFLLHRASTLHCTKGNNADTTRMFYRASEAFLNGKQGEIFVKNLLNLVKNAKNVHKSAYFSSWNECPPGHTKFSIVQWRLVTGQGSNC